MCIYETYVSSGLNAAKGEIETLKTSLEEEKIQKTQGKFYLLLNCESNKHNNNILVIYCYLQGITQIIFVKKDQHFKNIKFLDFIYYGNQTN